MKYTKYPVIIEAFQAGHDPLPEWFEEKIDSGEIILKGEGDTFCDIRGWFKDTAVKRGEYIIKGPHHLVTMSKEYFESHYLMGDLTDTYTLGFELDQALKNFAGRFATPTTTYNSLHEDLRDLRRMVKDDEIQPFREQLLIIAVTALKARGDLDES